MQATTYYSICLPACLQLLTFTLVPQYVVTQGISMITVAVELHVLGDQQKLPGRHQLRYGHALICVFFTFVLRILISQQNSAMIWYTQLPYE